MGVILLYPASIAWKGSAGQCQTRQNKTKQRKAGKSRLFRGTARHLLCSAPLQWKNRNIFQATGMPETSSKKSKSSLLWPSLVWLSFLWLSLFWFTLLWLSLSLSLSFSTWSSSNKKSSFRTVHNPGDDTSLNPSPTPQKEEEANAESNSIIFFVVFIPHHYRMQGRGGTDWQTHTDGYYNI